MDKIVKKYTTEAAAARKEIIVKFVSLDGFMEEMVADPLALSARFAVAPSDSAAIGMNEAVSHAVERIQAELAFAVAAFGKIQAWLQLCIPSVEDGNNFGVGIVLEAIKLVAEQKKEMTEAMKSLPDYFKERAAAAEKLSPKVSVSASEGVSASTEKETKASAEESTSTKTGNSTSQKKETSSASAVPDAVAHLVALDVCWYLRLHATGDRLKLAYATICDFIDKNEKRIAEPKGSGSGLSMF
jgi:hypothetical protein